MKPPSSIFGRIRPAATSGTPASLRVLLALALSLLAPTARAATYALGTSSLVEGPSAGVGSIVLAVTPTTGAWTASANSSWLHVTSGSTGGTGSRIILFSFDANTGVTRSGTFTIGGQTLTITQAGATYTPVSLITPVVSSGLTFPQEVALDAAGNIYIADTGSEAVREWMPSTQTLVPLVTTGLNNPYGVAVNAAGSTVYIANSSYNEIEKLAVSTGTITPVVTSGLYQPEGIALDSAGNIYIADTQDNAVKEWSAATGMVTTLVSSGLDLPIGVAVDAAGNVYIADALDNAIKEYSPATGIVTPLITSGLNIPTGVAVDGAGNVYIADQSDNAIKEWVAATGTLATLDSSGLYYPQAIAVDGAGNVYFADTDNDAIKEIPIAFVDPTPRTEPTTAGSDALPVVLPTTASLAGPFAPTSDQSWLTLGAISGGVVSFSFTANSAHGTRTAHITLLGQSITVAQEPPPFFLASPSLVEGPASGGGSVILTVTPPTGSWTAAANDSWLHLSSGSAGGTGSANVFFTFDANAGATRAGTLTIAGQTLTVTQAGSGYQAASAVAPLVSSGLFDPQAVAVDSLGNVYISDPSDGIKEWSPATNTDVTLFSPAYNIYGLAVDSLGNLYLADAGNNAIEEWSPATQTLVTLVTGLNSPHGVAVDGSGNVYIADTYNNAIKEWSPATQTLTTLVSTGLSYPQGVAVDASGNVYIADSNNSAIKMWSASTQAVTQLFSVSYPSAVAVDGSGNVYCTSYGAISEWSAATATASYLLTTGVSNPTGVAVDGLGNVYFSDNGTVSVRELARAFVDPTTRSEPAGAGSDALPMVLPASENLRPPFAPTSNQSWLTIGASSNGVVSFSVSANSSGPRFGQITLLGQSIPVLQAPGPYVLGASSLTVGPAAGSDSVVLTVTPSTGAWTAAADAGWLHVTPGSVGGVGSANVLLSFDPNPGATRTGTITIGGQALTITQAGSTYLPVTAVTALVSSGLSFPGGVAVDGSGNVYIADTNHSAIKEWLPGTNTVATLISSGLSYPGGVAVDGFGNIFIANTYDNLVVEELVPATIATNTGTSLAATFLAAPGFNHPAGLAVDGVGNAYVADTGNSAIKELVVATGTTTLVSTGLSSPYGVAVDASGNVYIADTDNSAIRVWSPSTQTIATLVSTGLLYPQGVAVDGSGDVYIADTSSSAIEVWSPATQAVTPLVSTGLSFPSGVAVDGARNVYIADYGNAAIKELPHAFVDPTSRAEPAAAGSDVLPVVLPFTASLQAPFAPSSDQGWLTIGAISNGIVSFNFTANPGPPRTAHITLLGESIAVTQAAHSPPVAVNDTAYASTAAPITINVLANDLAFGYTVEIEKLTQPAHGRAKLNPNHTITYTPSASFAGFAGADSFTYTISDGLGDMSTATVTIRNPFDPIKGAYDGLALYSGGSLNGTANGYLTLALTTSGSFTGSLKLAGFSYAFSGALAPATGTAGVAIKRAGQTPITLALSLNEATGTNLAVTISADGHTYTVTPGPREPYTNASPAPSAGAYTAIVSPPTSTSSPDLPAGSGWATMAVSKSGTVALAGRLGDGTAFSVGSLLHHGANDTFALYAPLYAGVSQPSAPGSIVGTITIEPLTDSDCDGSLAWVKPVQTAGDFYESGFNASAKFTAARYAGKTSAQVLTFTNKTAGAGTLTLSLGSAYTPTSIPLTVSSRNVVTANHPNPDKLTLEINAVAGTFLGAVVIGAGSPTSAISGVIYQKTNTGAGFYFAPSLTGNVTLTPQ